VANNVERVLADIDADDGNGSLGGPGHGFNCWRGRSTAGPSH
jgi:hypothetical protein